MRLSYSMRKDSESKPKSPIAEQMKLLSIEERWSMKPRLKLKSRLNNRVQRLSTGDNFH